jgi:hypothetical protein
MAKHYARGPDSADVIAKGAVDACLPQRQFLAQTMQGEGISANFILRTIEEAEAGLIRRTTLQVLEFRTKK